MLLSSSSTSSKSLSNKSSPLAISCACCWRSSNRCKMSGASNAYGGRPLASKYGIVMDKIIRTRCLTSSGIFYASGTFYQYGLDIYSIVVVCWSTSIHNTYSAPSLGSWAVNGIPSKTILRYSSNKIISCSRSRRHLSCHYNSFAVIMAYRVRSKWSVSLNPKMVSQELIRNHPRTTTSATNSTQQITTTMIISLLFIDLM